MKSITVVAAAALALWALPASANEPEKSESQQDRFAHCAHESKGLHREERQEFMQECLKTHKDGAAKEHHQKTAAEPSQQSKMTTCNEEARKKDLHGDERRAFMSTCLKAS